MPGVVVVELGGEGWMSASTVGGSDFKSFALGFAAGIDFDLPAEEGEAYTEGFYAGFWPQLETAGRWFLKRLLGKFRRRTILGCLSDF